MLQQNLNDEKEVITATSYEDLNLTVASKITAQEIDSFIAKYHSDSPLVGHGQDFINAQNQYGVSAHYLAAHAILESDTENQKSHIKNIIYSVYVHMMEIRLNMRNIYQATAIVLLITLIMYEKDI